MAETPKQQGWGFNQPLKSRCFDTRLNPASDPRVASCLGEAGVDAQPQLLNAASPQLRDSPVPRHWPCLCPLPLLLGWSPQLPQDWIWWLSVSFKGRSGSTAGCICGGRGHHQGHHQQPSLRPPVPPGASSPVTGAVPVPPQHRKRSTCITRAAPARQAASTSRGTRDKKQLCCCFPLE